MRLVQLGTAFVLGVALMCSCESGKQESASSDDKVSDVEMWVTTGDRSILMQPLNDKIAAGIYDGAPTVKIDAEKVYQTMDGFGFSLTGGSAMLLNTKLSAEKRAEILRELFTTEGNNIGVSYLRISIGASDLDERVFTYVDVAPGRGDDLSGFSLGYDKEHLIPVLKEILALNPDIKIMGSPWTAPAWMKTNNHVKGGSLRKESYSDYARYFVRYIREMEKEGVTIDAITIQNEPENPKNTPSMLMTAEEQADFIKNHLGPAFEQAGIKTKIVVFDHNCDNPEYPITILNDADAKKYVDGSAFHMYLGEINAMSKVHEAHPDKHLYFTEQWTSGEGDFDGDLFWHTRELMIGAPRNWSRNVLEWNLAADPNFDPHTDEGGCTICQGALTVDTESVSRNVSYYIIAHGSKFVPDGSVRVDSNIPDGLPNVAYVTPEGKKVLHVLNESSSEKTFNVEAGEKKFAVTLPKGSVATVVW